MGQPIRIHRITLTENPNEKFYFDKNCFCSHSSSPALFSSQFLVYFFRRSEKKERESYIFIIEDV